MEISVVIPLYNKAHRIARTLQSIIGQTWRDFEVIVVDDGSTDGGGEIVCSFRDPRVRLVKQDNKGVADARNRGVREASGDYIAFIDGDDEWAPEYLATAHELIVHFPQAGMFCFGGLVKEEGNDKVFERVIPQFRDRTLLIDYFENPDMTSHTSATVVKRSFFWQAQGFPSGMRRLEDFACWCRIAMISPVVYCGKPLSTYWGNIPGQITHLPRAEQEKMWPSITRYYNELVSFSITIDFRSVYFIRYIKHDVRSRFYHAILENDQTKYIFFQKHFDQVVWKLLPERAIYHWRWCWRYIVFFVVFITKCIWCIERKVHARRDRKKMK